MAKTSFSLPNSDRCIVPDEKITGYLLSSVHKFGAGKAKFLGQFGFSPDRKEELVGALMRHAACNDVAVSETTVHGVLYNAVGRLEWSKSLGSGSLDSQNW